MSITVVCPSCRKRFKVSEKFAGRTGPCPNCKRPLHVPTKEEEVQVIAPEEFASGGKSAAGKMITKPIDRIDVQFQPLVAVIIAAAAVGVVALTWFGRSLGLFASPGGPLLITVGLLAISPVLAIAAYSFLRDDELEPYSGKSLYIRAALCGLVYTVLWGIFAVLISSGIVTRDLWTWLYTAPVVFAVGGFAAMSFFDLDFGNGIFHYSFYILVTVFLRWVAGLPWWR